MQVVIEIPKEVLYDTKQTIEQATDFAKSVTALGFYKQYYQAHYNKLIFHL